MKTPLNFVISDKFDAEVAMTTFLPQSPEIFYPSSDGEPLAETSVHADAIIYAVVALRQYLANSPPGRAEHEQTAIVLADQFLYYAQGFPRLRVAPDVMVIFDVPPGPRDNYKIWEEGQIPSVIFEFTSKSTRDEDTREKKTLYERLGVQEYWLFDPKGEWISEQLRGYRLQDETYQSITDRFSEALRLRLEIDGQRIAFYRQDNGEKLLEPDELVEVLRLERQRAEQAEQRAEQAEQQIEQLKAQLRSLGVDLEQ
jgi:Uma2 family endonuclease